MKIKLDENLPTRMQGALSELGHDVDTVPDEGIAGHDDDDVWRYATGAGRFLVTQDLDFSDLRRFAPGTHPGILLVRMREPGREALMARVGGLFESEAVEQWEGCFVVATDCKLRIRRPI